MAGYKQGGYESSLCWECKNTNRFKCPWFNPANPQPVPGWVAERQVRTLLGETYTVKECPNFEPEPPREAPPPPPGMSIPGVQRKKTATGVYWVARLTHGSKNYYLGCFPSPEEAVAARRAAEKAVARGEEPRRVQVARTIGCPGVYPGVRRWMARITYQGRRYYLGNFKTEEEAVTARLAAEEAIKRGEVPKRATQEEKRGGD